MLQNWLTVHVLLFVVAVALEVEVAVVWVHQNAAGRT